MVTITLYENCFLNNKYQEVMSVQKREGSNKSILETYLDTLTRKIYTMESIYYENDFEIVMDLEEVIEGVSKSIFSYNYMKIEDDTSGNRITRYCFINSISIKHKCVYIKFEEDIYSTFADKITASQNCLLKSSRLCSYYGGDGLGFHKLPVNYDGNNGLTAYHFNDKSYDKMYVIVQLQNYSLTSGDKLSEFDVGFYVLAKGQGSDTDLTEDSFLLTKSEVNTALQWILNYTVSAQYTFNHTGLIYHYNIGDIYIVPKWFNIKSLLKKSLTNPNNYYITAHSDVFGTKAGRFLIEFDSSKLDELYTLAQFTIPKNWNNFSFGTYTLQKKIENNNTDILCDLLIGVSKNGFTIKVSVQNEIIDFTNEFNYVAPYELISTAEYQQRKIGLYLKNNNIDYKMYETGVDISDQQNKIVGGVGSAIGSGYSGNMGGIFSGAEHAVSALHNTLKDIGLEFKLSKDKALINKPIYSNGKGTFKNSSFFLNYYYGFIYTKIYPDNTWYVKNFVDNFGFDTYSIIYESEFNSLFSVANADDLGANYDIIKTEGCNVYGKFPNEIAIRLNQIFDSGIKIWYDANRGDDTFTNNLLIWS